MSQCRNAAQADRGSGVWGGKSSFASFFPLRGAALGTLNDRRICAALGPAYDFRSRLRGVAGGAAKKNDGLPGEARRDGFTSIVAHWMLL